MMRHITTIMESVSFFSVRTRQLSRGGSLRLRCPAIFRLDPLNLLVDDISKRLFVQFHALVSGDGFVRVGIEDRLFGFKQGSDPLIDGVLA